MKRSFTNAALTLILIIGACISASAQSQRTRDKLFPSFQQDVAAMKKNATTDPRATATSTRSLIFTNYQPGANNSSARRIIQRPVTTAGKQSLPSDISSADATSKIAPQAKIVKQPLVPKQ